MYWLSKKDKFSIYSHAIFSVFHCLPAIKGRRYVCELSIGTAKYVINRFFTAQFFSCHFCIQYIVIQDWWTKCSCGRKRSDKLWNFWWLETAIQRHWTTHSIYFYSLLSYALKNILCYFHFIAVFSQPQCVAAIFFRLSAPSPEVILPVSFCIRFFLCAAAYIVLCYLVVSFEEFRSLFFFRFLIRSCVLIAVFLFVSSPLTSNRCWCVCKATNWYGKMPTEVWW